MADNFNPSHPFIFTKLDIKDGFWRMRVSDEDAWNFAYVLPSLQDTTTMDIDLVVPNSLQMGWCESPPFFCSGSETARDTIEHIINNQSLPFHQFENNMLQNIVTDSTVTPKGSTTLFEVFVDDFICATNNSNQIHLRQTS
jgi:hypothetical protein